MNEWKATVVVEVRRDVFVWADDEDEARDFAVDEASEAFGHDGVVDVEVEAVTAATAGRS